MIEELKLIMGALEGVTQGAIWAFVAYIAYKLAIAGMTVGVIFYAIKGAIGLIDVWLRSNRVNKNYWNVYQWNQRTADGISRIDAYFSKEDMQYFLAEIAGPNGSIHGVDIREAVADIRKARAK